MTSLHITLDRKSRLSLGTQLINALKQHVMANHALSNLRLPSSRILARDLGVSRIVTLTAYEQLIAEGYLVSRMGSGTFINKDIMSPNLKQDFTSKDFQGPGWIKSESLIKADPHYDIEFSLGRPSARQFDDAAWKRSWRQALSKPFYNATLPPEGIAPLREAIANMVARNRGIQCVADDIIITTGSVDIITLIARVTAPFKPIICLENPGFAAARDIFQRYGHEIQPIGIDQEGLILSDLPTMPNRAKLLFCTPSHQFPLGFRLSLPRRIALLDWAKRHDAFILEDDYDSEFRYNVAPLPSLKAQDETGHVIYFSSMSKSLSPAIRLGYMIAPEAMRRAITPEIEKNHMQPPWLLQQAMAHFIQRGELDKHIRRMHRHYAILNKEMHKGLAHLPKGFNIFGLDAGLHCFLEISADMADMNVKKLHDHLQEKGVNLNNITHCHFAPSPWHGFTLGYGHLDVDLIKDGLKKIAATLETP